MVVDLAFLAEVETLFFSKERNSCEVSSVNTSANSRKAQCDNFVRNNLSITSSTRKYETADCKSIVEQFPALDR